jgi:ubiquinone/menaquinone biosynthesis C-methylase UbiE
MHHSSATARTRDVGDFADVDGDAAPERLVSFLDEASQQASVRAYKEASFGLLRLARGSRVLDVGCGLGDDLVLLAPRVGPEGRLVGVDQSNVMLRAARARIGGLAVQVELHEGSTLALGMPDASFDAVRADRVLHFLEDGAGAINEMTRVARAGGRVVVSEPDHDTLVVDTSEPELMARILDWRRRRAQLPTPGRRLRRLFADAGLSEIEVVAHAGVVTSLAVAERLLGLGRMAQGAVAAGELSLVEALQWQAAAARDAESGRFLAAMTVFSVGGTLG